MKIKYVFAAFFLLLIQTGIYSQGIISGMIVDSKDNTPVKDAGIRLFLSGDSSLIKGIASGTNGEFSFDNLKEGKYKIEILLTGYALLKIDKIPVTENKPVYKLDTLRLKPESFRTEEIVVQDEKPLMELSDDKKIFNVSETMVSQGGTALDVLRKIPMLDVDQNDNVTLRGSRNALILIDNKPMKFSSLRQLPANAIKTVEIITNPSAKYEAEGVTGIINITLKAIDENQLGYNGNAYTGVSTTGRIFGSLGINLNTGKWSIFVNGGGGYFPNKTSSNTSTDYYIPISFLRSSMEGNGKSKYYFGNFGTEYSINKKHSIGFDSYLNLGTFDNTNVINSTNYDGVFIPTYYSLNKGGYNGDFNNYSGSLYYTGKLNDKGREISAEATYTGIKNKYTSDQSLQYYDVNNNPNGLLSVQRNSTDENSKNLTVQTDYTHPIGEKSKIEAGYKGIFRSNDNDFKSDTLNNNIYINNTNLSNRFKLTENINAVYGTYAQTINKFRFKLGLRFEHTHTLGEQFTNPFSFTKDYLDYFPTLSLSQKLGTIHEIQLSYSRRITRPMIYRLNPFVNKYNNRYIYFGNPELNPEYTNSFELSYNLFWQVATITPLIFYRHTRDVISNYSYLIDSNVTVSTFKNASSADAYGMDFLVNSRAFKWWTINASFSFYQTKFNGGVTDELAPEEGFSWKGNIRSFFTIEDLFNIEVYYNYNGKKINASGYSKPSSSFDIGLSRQFFNKKLTITIRGEDVFKTRNWGNVSDGIGFHSENETSFNSQAISLNISYTFGNSDKYYSKSKKTKQNENEGTDTKEEGK